MSKADYFLTTFKGAAAEVAAEIPRATELLAKPFPGDDPLKNEISRFITEGGKRFRPALSLITARAFGHDDIFPHLALETFHKYLLAHDDVIDCDSIRYGAPTIHAKMATHHKGTGKQHFGNSLAIIAGDLIEAATTKIILHSRLTPKTKFNLQMLTTQALEEVAWGWYDQFLMDYLPLSSKKLSFERIETSIIWVTGKYSLKLPLYFGYAVAGKRPPKNLKRLSDVMGALFQTGDDVMGLFGKIEETGKSNFGDIIQGKKTLPMWLTYANAAPADKKVLQAALGNRDVTTEQVEEVRAIIIRSGGLEKTKQLMAAYRDECLDLINKTALPAELKDFLAGCAYYLEGREA